MKKRLMSQQHKIIQIAQVEQYFSVTWRLGIRCNYDCMYCSSQWHDNISPHHSLDTLKQSWGSLYEKTNHKNLPYKISFTGGELTTSKHFMPFLSWLRENYDSKIHKILLTTNGSATLKYYLKMYELVDSISFSVHSEHINEREYFSMILELNKAIDKSKYLQVNIMDEFWNQSRIPYYKEFLEKNNINYNVNIINYSHKTRDFPIFNGDLNFEI